MQLRRGVINATRKSGHRDAWENLGFILKVWKLVCTGGRTGNLTYRGDEDTPAVFIPPPLEG